MALHQIIVEPDIALFSQGAMMANYQKRYLKEKYSELDGKRKLLVIPLLGGKLLVRFWIDQSIRTISIDGKEKYVSCNYIGMYETVLPVRRDEVKEGILQKLAHAAADVEEELTITICRKSHAVSN